LERRLRLAAAPAPAAVPDAAGEPDEAVVAAAAAEPAAEAPPWPGEADEASFLAESQLRGETVPPVPPVPPAAEETESAGPLPPLEELVARVPAEIREALDDLFRAKFTRVVRVAPAALKP
jgi:hypothetical protein